MRFVLDASVAAKLVLQEPDSDQAVAAIAKAEFLAAPDHLLTEVASVLLKAARQGAFDANLVEAAVEAVRRLPAVIVPASELLGEAIAIARLLRHPIYDCLYMALARRMGAIVVTADIDLVRVCNRSPEWSEAAIPLSRVSAYP